MSGVSISSGRPVVHKFGGTSVGGVEPMRRVARIVGDVPCFVVLSAMSGVTNLLLEMVEAASRGEAAAVDVRLKELHRRHHEVATELLEQSSTTHPVGARIDAMLDEARAITGGILLLREASPRSRDAVAGLGERLSCALFTAYQLLRGVEVVHHDARSWLITDDRFGQARPISSLVEGRIATLKAAWESGHQVVTEGFLGATAEGLATTLGRGGSDYTASILGAAVDAERIDIWTDVTGVLTADPRVVKGARQVPRLSYGEAAELAYFGAKVLHPATVRPAVEKGIPVLVKNSMEPENPGTCIDRSGDGTRPVKAITTKKRQVSVTIESDRMLGAHGFLRSVFEVFDRHAISVDVVATAEVSVTITLDPHPALAAAVTDLARFGQVTTQEGRAMLAVIGEGVKYTPGIGAKVFGALEGINIEMISMGASQLNLTILMDEAFLASALAKVHWVLFEGAGE